MMRWVLIGVVGLVVMGSIASWLSGRELEAATDPVQIAELVLHPEEGALVVELHESTNVLDVEYYVSDSWSAKRLIDSWHDKATRLMPALFSKVDGIEKVRFVLLTNFVDQRGNAKKEQAARMMFSRDGSARVNWKGVDWDAIPHIADDYWLKLAIRRELK